MPFVKNIKGKKKAFQRDEAQENNQTGCRNTDNSLKTKEIYDTNRYNVSDRNREYDTHPRYQPRNLKTLTSHTTKTEEDHIIENNKLIKT